MRTKARIRYKKHERVHRQATERLIEGMSADQRKIVRYAWEKYSPEEIARELALPLEYVEHFMTGLIQRLTHEGLIPSPDWRNVLKWADENGLLIPS